MAGQCVRFYAGSPRKPLPSSSGMIECGACGKGVECPSHADTIKSEQASMASPLNGLSPYWCTVKTYRIIRIMVHILSLVDEGHVSLVVARACADSLATRKDARVYNAKPCGLSI